MIKWCLSLGTTLMLVIFSLLAVSWNVNQNRVLRQELNQLRQLATISNEQRNTFNASVNEDMLRLFSQTFEELKIQIADYFKRLEDSAVVFNLDFKQIENTVESSATQTPKSSILRIAVSFETDSEVTALNLLQDLKASAVRWPIEFPGCHLVRLSSKSFKTSCVADIFFWAL